MTEQEALAILEDMPEPKFQKFFKSLPLRTQYGCRLISWKEVLPEWYIHLNKEES